MQSLESEPAPKPSTSRLARGPSTERLKALGVVDSDDWAKGVTFADWCSLIQRSFERHFWIPEDKAEDASYAIGSLSPWARGVYKDCLGCEDEWCMLQLRPNQAVAMAVAPFLFDPDHARVSHPLALCISRTCRSPAFVLIAGEQVALRCCRERLLSKMGMRVRACGCVLAPFSSVDCCCRRSTAATWRTARITTGRRCAMLALSHTFHVFRISAEDGTDKSTAKGWNYHQGPGAAHAAARLRHAPCASASASLFLIVLRMAVAHRLLPARLRPAPQAAAVYRRPVLHSAAAGPSLVR